MSEEPCPPARASRETEYLSTATPFPFDPPPGAGAKSAAPAGNASARAGQPGAQDAGNGESDFARSLLEVQENEATAGGTADAAQAGAAGTQAVAATENGETPHEVSQFLARLFAGEHPNQPAPGKASAPDQKSGEDAAIEHPAAATGDVLPDTEAAEGGAPAADPPTGPIADPALLAALAASEGETAAPPAGKGEAAPGQTSDPTAAAPAAPPTSTVAPPAGDAEVNGEEGTRAHDGKAEVTEPAPAANAAPNPAPQSEAARARNAAHLQPLPENANPRAQAMARPQPDGQAVADDAALAGEGKSGKRAEGADTAAVNAAARRNDAAARPAPPMPQAAPQTAPQPQAALPATGLEGQITDDAALAGTGGTQSLNQSAQSGAATQLANQYSPAATVPLAQLAAQIAARHRAGHSRFEIRIDPPELGRVDVRLDMGQDGSVTTRMVVERAETLDLLQRDARALERALGEAGLDAQEGSLQFSLKGEGFGQQQAERGEADMTAAAETADELSGERRAGESQYRHTSLSDRALDIRV